MKRDQERSVQLAGAASLPPRGDVADAIARVASLLAGADIDGALRYLNGRTRFRFTGLFRVDPPVLRNVRLVDRENPALDVSGAVSTVDIGYCGVACAAHAPFVTTDSRQDSRLESHPARESMISYAGVPIRMPGGLTWGTLCHFDVRPRLIPPTEVTILEGATPLMMEWIALNWSELRQS